MPMFDPVAPGEIIREDVIAAAGLTVAEAARRLGVSRVALSRVVNGHAAVSTNLALRLEAAGVSTARMWMEMQTAYDLAQAQKGEIPKLPPLFAA